MINPSEIEVRAMRDKIYGKPTTDKNWDGCRAGWMKSVGWMETQIKQNKIYADKYNAVPIAQTKRENSNTVQSS